VTGPEHYAEAEYLMAEVMNRPTPAAEIMAAAALAQVHATLALVDAVRRSGVDGKEIGRAINEAARTGVRRSRSS
jgi:hypothetical protein